MTLSEYMTKTKTTATAIAKQIGRSVAFVTMLRKGTANPSIATARALYAATGGKVDWLRDGTISERVSKS
jgi:transcriptional regulator with XRE-family HTH domain